VLDPVANPEEKREEGDLVASHHAIDEGRGSDKQHPASMSETERTPEAAFSTDAGRPEPERPVVTGSEKSSTPRRGWWQRLIQP
jgi:hypothetical protein